MIKQGCELELELELDRDRIERKYNSSVQKYMWTKLGASDTPCSVAK